MVATIRVRPAIVLFGDSITQHGFGEDGAVGWASLLASAYSRRADVLNRGFSGYNTRHAIDVLPSVFGPHSGEANVGSPLFCTVFFGANDACLPGGRQHVPLEEYTDNTRRIVTSIRELLGRTEGTWRTEGTSCSSVPIILFTPPPVNTTAWDRYCEESFKELSPRSNEAAKEYGDSVKNVGVDMGCPVLDVFDLLGGNGDSYGEHLSDGLHLNGSGNTLIYEGLMNLIVREFPHLAPMKDGDGRYGTIGLPLEEKLWKELC